MTYEFEILMCLLIFTICVCVCVLVTQLCLTLCHPMDCSPPGSPVHGILQARILDCVAIPFSRGSSCPGDWTQDSCIAGGFFTHWATKEVLSLENNLIPMHIKCPWYVAFWDSRYWAHIFMMPAQDSMKFLNTLRTFSFSVDWSAIWMRKKERETWK